MGTGDIKTSLRRIVGFSDNVFIIAKVDKVDGMLVDVTPVDDDIAPICGVRLKTTDADDGLIITPKIGSMVIVSMLSEVDGYVSMWSEIESIKLVVDESDVELTGKEIVINGGDNKGLVKIKELTDKLNGLKDTVDALVKSYNGHVHTTTATVGVGLVGVISPIVVPAQPPQPFNANDYENNKIKH